MYLKYNGTLQWAAMLFVKYSVFCIDPSDKNDLQFLRMNDDKLVP